MSVLRVTPDAVAQSGGQVAGASQTTVPAPEVTAAASDPVSVSVAHALGVRIAQIGAATQTGHGATQQAAAHLNADAFAGGEVGATVQYELGPVDLSLGATGQAGVGASGGLDFGMEGGKLVIGGNAGLAWGLGGKIAPHIAVDPNVLTGGFKNVTDWVKGLFG